MTRKMYMNQILNLWCNIQAEPEVADKEEEEEEAVEEEEKEDIAEESMTNDTSQNGLDSTNESLNESQESPIRTLLGNGDASPEVQAAEGKNSAGPMMTPYKRKVGSGGSYAKCPFCPYVSMRNFNTSRHIKHVHSK